MTEPHRRGAPSTGVADALASDTPSRNGQSPFAPLLLTMRAFFVSSFRIKASKSSGVLAAQYSRSLMRRGSIVAVGERPHESGALADRQQT